MVHLRATTVSKKTWCHFFFSSVVAESSQNSTPVPESQAKLRKASVKKSTKKVQIDNSDEHHHSHSNGSLPSQDIVSPTDGSSGDKQLRPHAYLLNSSKETTPLRDVSRQTIVEEKEDENQNEIQQQEVAVGNNTGGPDPIIGRYRMTSSDGFEEWMKAMGVGWTKRKLANSVVPVNVVEISDDGGELTSDQPVQ